MAVFQGLGISVQLVEGKSKVLGTHCDFLHCFLFYFPLFSALRPSFPELGLILILLTLLLGDWGGLFCSCLENALKSSDERC